MRTWWVTLGLLACTIALAADFSTPTQALRSLEEAYARKDVAAVLAARDFRFEAREMVQAILERAGQSGPPDEKLVAEATEVLELSFRKQMKTQGFPDVASYRCTVVGEKTLRTDVVELTEECVASDGAKSRQTLHAAKGKDGWRIVTMPPKP